jgi:enoyl reductase-like protein
MKRDFIAEILKEHIEDEAVLKDITDKVMAENGRDIEKAKGDFETLEGERNNLKEQLESVNSKLAEFKDVDPKALNEEIAKLTQSLADKDKEYQDKIADMQFSQMVTKYINKAGGRNEKAIKALLDVETLKQSQNQEKDLETAISTLKTDADYLFKSDEPIQNPSAPTGGSVDSGTDALRAAMGLPPEN